jgi:hypothetical protein
MQVIPAELKYKDFSVGTTAVSDLITAAKTDPGTVECLSATDQGTARTQRIGNKIMITSLMITGQFEWHTGSSIGQWVRTLVWVDRATNLAITPPSCSDVLFDNYSTYLKCLSLKNLGNEKRIRILADQQHTPSVSNNFTYYNGSAVVYVKSYEPFKHFFKFKTPIEVNFQSTGGNITDVLDNAIHIAFIAPDAGVVNVSYTARMRYYD